jgi:outer membrane protein OmpA-like peptidoglycan-associated protein
VGYAQLHPIASNAGAAGRSRNRRVEIVLLRVNDNASP